MTTGPARLKRSADFQTVFKEGRRRRTPSLTIITRAGSTNETRVGVVVSKKIDKRATRRNYLRRCLMEAIRTNPDPWRQCVGQDIVLLVSRAPAKKPLAVFSLELNEWLKG